WTRTHFTAFFSLFSRIDTLVLDNFKREKVFEAVEKTLKNVGINRLDIRLDQLTNVLQGGIIRLCLNNGIRHILVTVNPGKINEFEEFVKQLSELGMTFDVYERNGDVDIQYFGKSAEYWNLKAGELMMSGIEMQMVTQSDATFDHGGYELRGVRAHIRCGKMEEQDTQPLRPLPLSRGYMPR
ncbi:hypothetical protein PENTCL1PPCAC_12070, partial [Pristionchus entomophagus]